jgi:vitamin B12 transporter
MIQALPPADPPEIIVVSGTALPPPGAERALHVQRIRPDADRAAGPVPLERLLERFAGLQMFRRSDSRSGHPTSQGITLRALGGNASSRAVLLLDGVPQSDPFGGWLSWPSFSTIALSEIKLVRGGGSVTAGPGALAGTIELSSGSRPRAVATASVGSRRSVSADALATGDIGSGALSLSFNADRGDGFIPVAQRSRGAADRRAPHESLSARARWVVPVSAVTELQASASGFTDRRERGLAYTENRTSGADLSARLVSRGNLPWSVLLYGQTRDFQSSFATVDASRGTSRRVSLQYDVPGDSVGWSAQLRPRLANNVELVFGADGRLLTGGSNEFANYVADRPTRERSSGGRAAHAGLFGEVTGRISALTLTAGARVDRWRVNGGRLQEFSIDPGTALTDERFATREGWLPTGRIGGSLQAHESLSLRAAAYAAWRQPTLNELFRPFRAGSDATAANPRLDPERSEGIEAGTDWKHGAWSASATLFRNRLNDPIANVTLGSGPGVFPGVGFVAGSYRQRQNLSAIRVRGVEVSGSWSDQGWFADANVSVTRARVESPNSPELDGLRPAQTPIFSGSLSMGWEGGGTSLDATVRRESSRFEDDLNMVRLPAATTVDIGGAISLSPPLSISARVENLFDRDNAAGISGDWIVERSTPRTIWLGLRLGGSRGR